MYTQLRASDLKLENRTWMLGTEIGVAASKDGGKKWKYVGTAQGLAFEHGLVGSTFRSPNLVFHSDKTKDPLRNFNGQPKLYHLHLTYMKGFDPKLNNKQMSASARRKSLKPENQQGSLSLLHYVAEDVLGAWTFKVE
jgi:hypothetical protein